MKLISWFLMLLHSFLCMVSCRQSYERQPEKLPYRFQNLQSLIEDDIVLADLNSDGFTEIVAICSSKAITKSLIGSFIKLSTFEHNVIEQVNYSGKIIREVTILDYDGDGSQEIFIPFVQNDSLFVSAVNDRGEKLFHFFLINGQSRIDKDGSIFKWYPVVWNFYVQDLNNDGERELITVITTYYARQPRGLLVHSLPQGRLLGKQLIGCSPRDNFLDDFDRDGHAEILCSGTAPNNGANDGGFDDAHSYLITFNLVPRPAVTKSKQVGDKFFNYSLFYEDVDADGQKELIAYTETLAQAPTSPPKIMELNPVTFDEINRREFSKSITIACLGNLDYNAKLEIVGLLAQKDIVVLNSNFAEINRHSFPFPINNLWILPDLDNDGRHEVMISSNEGSFLLNAELETIACFPQLHYAGVLRRGLSLPPLLLMRASDQYLVVQLAKNHFYLIRRFYPIMLYVIGCCFFLLLTHLYTKLFRENRLLKHIQRLTIDSDLRGFLLFDSRQQIRMMNNTLRRWLGLNGSHKARHLRVLDVFSHCPEMLSFFNDNLYQPAQRHEKIMQLSFNGHRRNIKAIMDPLPVKVHKKPFWLVAIIDQSANDELLQAKTWCKMAQKTAHDIKNPLSAIMLTLQRLQMFTQEQVGKQAEVFEPYFARIIERIESLRRISKNFMKFVNLETLNLTCTSINEFLADGIKMIRQGLPPDIQLDLKTTAENPMVRIDQEAMSSVLENLISNAINAMPQGGKISITTQFLHGLMLPGSSNQPQNYLLIEVLDTGIGMSDTVREHLFEPNFTTSENGNGLGLAYVKKTIDDHRGYIEVESEPGAGTAFSIYLPVV